MMDGVDPVQTQNGLLDAWQAQQNVQLALASAVMKQDQKIAAVQGEAIVKLIEEMPRMDGTGQLIQKSA
jgi:hypothetical protein